MNISTAQQAFDEGDYQECLRLLAFAFREDVNYLPLYELSAKALKKLDGHEEAELFLAVLQSPNDANAYYTLGDFYFKVGHYSMAQAFFEKTFELEPDHEYVYHDLAICYARQFQVDKAIEMLEQRSKMFWDFYFLYKCKILGGHIEGMEQNLDELDKALDGHAAEDVVVLRQKLGEVREMLHRYKLIGQPEMHIRDWHFIQYGGAILDFFETGSDDYVAGGRYVALFGSNESLRSVVKKLQQFIQKLQLSFKKVLSLDNDSEIMARLVAKELELGFEFYDPAQSSEHCLIVAADSVLFNKYEELVNVSEGQLTFALNHSWLDACIISPDVIGFMTQTYTFPWHQSQAGLSEEEIATQIFNTATDAEDDGSNLEFYAKYKEYLKGIGNLAGNTRHLFAVESPVTGSYFA